MPYTRGKLSKQILLFLGTAGLLAVAPVMPNLTRTLKPVLRRLTQEFKTKPFSIRKALFALKARRLVEFKERNGKLYLTLTENGRRRVLSYQMETLTLKKPKRWDGHWRIVIFDIPETQRVARNAFRALLNRLGFYQLQKSCFIHPYECKSEVDFVSEVFQIAPYVHYISARTLDGGELLKKHFEL